MKKILIASAGVGVGHNRAAQALKLWCEKEFSGEAVAQWTDCLKFVSRLFSAAYADSYQFLTNRTPALWGFLYQIANVADVIYRFIKTADAVIYTNFTNFVKDFKPECIICTHFLPANVIISHFGDRIPVFVIVTDYTTHLFWINKCATGYFVASEDVKKILESYGYPASRIKVTGIPIHPVFSQTAKARSNKLTILFMSGGFGLRSMKDAFERILKLDRDFRLIVVAGRNKRLKRKLEQIAGKDGRVRIVGFVTNIQDYMSESDFILGKAGGLSTTEALAMGLPLLIYAPTPGQEEKNRDFLVENGAALEADNLDTLESRINYLLDNKDVLSKMRKCANRAARPYAARDIISSVLNYDPSIYSGSS